MNLHKQLAFDLFIQRNQAAKLISMQLTMGSKRESLFKFKS